MTFELGKDYRTRGGWKARVVNIDGDGIEVFHSIKKEYWPSWTEDGHPADLIEEWKEEKRMTKSGTKILLRILSWFLTTGWIVYGLVQHDWILMCVTFSACCGTALHLAIARADEKKSDAV